MHAHACARKQTHKQYSGLGLVGKGWNEADGCPFYCYVTLLTTNLQANSAFFLDTRMLKVIHFHLL